MTAIQRMMTRNKTGTFMILLAVTFTSLPITGCDARISVMNQGDADRGLIVVLPGIDGRTGYNERACEVLSTGGTGMRVELFDWTLPLCLLTNLRDEGRNRRMAGKLADRIMSYGASHPGRPIFLIGHSGGTALAIWAAEALPAQQQVDGIVLLASSLSPGYDLSKALERTRGGVVSFCSGRDTALLGAGTTLFGTMDGKHTQAAGKVGFSVPESGRTAEAYGGFYEVRWDKSMAAAGNDGSHCGCLTSEFVSSYVAPLVAARQWDRDLITTVREGKGKDPVVALASE